MEKNVQSDALTLSEFLEWASIGRTKVYQEIDAGRFKIKKLGRKTLILRKDAISWLESLPDGGA